MTTSAVRAVSAGRCLQACLLAACLGLPTGRGQGSVPPGGPAAPSLADLSLEQLMEIPVETVVSASKYAQKITQAPASVTIVTAAEIAAYGHRTLADVLRAVRGLYVADDGNYSYLGARGFLRPGDYNTRVLLLIDGHRMNDNIYDSVYFGRDNVIDPEAIERVEVIRGPSSSLHGGSAFLGVINLVTKRGAQLDGARVATEAGSHGSQRGRVSFGRRLANGAEIALAASYFHSNGQPSIHYPEFDQRLSRDARATPDGLARNIDAETALGASGNFTYRDLTIAASVSSRTKTVPTASYGTVFNDGRNRTTDTRGYIDIAFERDLRPDLRFRARGFYDLYAYHGAYPYDFAAPGEPAELMVNRDRSLGDWMGAEWQLTAKVRERHTIVAGAEFRENLRQEQSSYYDTQPRTYLVDEQRDSRTVAAYLQTEFVLNPQVRLSGGARFDYYFGSFGGTTNPRVGLIYNPQERTTLKFLYGEAFRAPNVYERFYYPNPYAQLAPEKSRTFEIAAEHYFARHHRVGVSVYRYDVFDLISQDVTGAGEIYFANLDCARAQGVEVELEGKYQGGLHLRASYALQRAVDGVSGARLTGSPRHLAKAGVILPFGRERYTAGLELQYHGTARTLADRSARAFLLGNLTLTAHELPFARRIQAAVSVYNLLNTRYGYPGAEDHVQDILPQPGRTLNVRVTYKF